MLDQLGISENKRQLFWAHLKLEFQAIKERGEKSAEIGEGLLTEVSKLFDQFVERILTVVTTLRQQGRDALDYLTAICASVNQESGAICLAPNSS